MLMHGGNHINQEGDKLQILRWSLTRTKEVYARIGSERSVVMLSRTVDSLEGLLMQKHAEMVTAGNLIHDGHQ